MSIYVGGDTFISCDMQGPCSDGFYVITIDERKSSSGEGILSKLNTLGISNEDVFKYLKIPPTGSLSDNGTVYKQGEYGYTSLWTSSRNGQYAYSYSYANRGTGSTNRGLSIRPFKVIPVAPDSSWTTLYDGSSIATGAGIFHNATLGLISFSHNGTDWITLSDKNVGATQVYNYGDTLSESNCGGYFQFGNNYMFPFTGATSTTSTSVNASAYGPGNYYVGQNFRVSYDASATWDSSLNGNLWGGVTQGIGIKSAEIKDICIGEGIDDYSAMQGPCPDGFHVPNIDEWGSLINILKNTFGLPNSSSTMQTYLKMPMAGQRNCDSNVANQGSSGGYWSSVYYDGDRAYRIGFSSANINSRANGYRAYGFSVRCFKDSYVDPTSSWTVIQGTLGSAGIFWNQSEGLISITDGTTGYTIQDKNLGATTVYNDGDTLSEANCGKYFQWGNNYGFPRTGSVTTSSTQVNVSTYGPGNYYSSSTFITLYSRWDTTDNGNLRGGETGITKKGNVKDVYVGNTNIRTTVKYYVDFLLVGGGGAGGCGYNYCLGAGGGAGGYIECCQYQIQKGSYNITIGAGGANYGCNGGDSCFNEIISYGGGGGGGGGNHYAGCNGGSGGGGACRQAGGTGVSGQGNNGGNSPDYCSGGGGGGAGYAGCNSGSYRNGGNGGCGKCSNISGTNNWYSGGGGGAGYCSGGTGGCGGGGSGGNRCNSGNNASYYGGGGGGGGRNYGGGKGCQGIFIARYPTSCGYNITGGCKYTCGDYTIHCFTSDGTFTVS